ncbi:metal ABC transporter ATP-binding protein [Aeromicrobium sp. YIM 150415]|uniref:metal ABC transporter ATP-binding protein n=1 Tax=Aeromicrobium sp. YIM 150415 TaxID=2803912 RepID=UPI0019634484|nr:metal ABC transporter ATP-binding protein [Aeromicrobium sp. YIM 150415]MBM9465457.1 metal ABC transporter ATP-binding protein [Aeromicrobium sp. YIM 150415]
MTAVEVEEATVRRARRTVLRDVSVRVEAGRVCALLGMNGAGKSTLFDVIADRLPLAGGSIEVLGATPRKARRAGRVGYVVQSERIDLDFPVTVRGVVSMGITSRREARQRTDDAIERVGLQDLADRPLGRLSGGQRKRAFLARCLAQRAELILLDEPFAGVDRPSELTLRQAIGELAADGNTVIVSTHDVRELDSWCDDAIVLAGRVVASGPVRETVTAERLAQAFGWEGSA